VVAEVEVALTVPLPPVVVEGGGAKPVVPWVDPVPVVLPVCPVVAVTLCEPVVEVVVEFVVLE